MPADIQLVQVYRICTYSVGRASATVRVNPIQVIPLDFDTFQNGIQELDIFPFFITIKSMKVQLKNLPQYFL